MLALTKTSSLRRSLLTGGLVALAGAAVGLTGCASSKSGAQADATDAPREWNSLDDAAAASGSEGDGLAAQIAQDAEALEQWFKQGQAQATVDPDAERLREAQRRAQSNETPLEPVVDDSTPALAANAGVRIDDEPVEIEIAPEDAAQTMVDIPVETPAEPEPTREQRIERLTAELAARLREQADAGERPLHALAALAALELIQPGVYDQPGAAALLTSRERDALSLWRDMLRYAGRSLGENDSSNALLRSVRVASEQARDFATLELTKVALCARVDGFGQYVELDSTKMLAGQAHRVGLYVEVDGFGTRQASDDEGRPAHRVELTRELSLYHDADGLLAWRRPAVDITDSSLNRRRDFFFSEVIELPRTLSVGAYRLKVSVTDRVTGAVAESILAIDVVADPRLTRVR
jgi:hypothetical protein